MLLAPVSTWEMVLVCHPTESQLSHQEHLNENTSISSWIANLSTFLCLLYPHLPHPSPMSPKGKKRTHTHTEDFILSLEFYLSLRNSSIRTWMDYRETESPSQSCLGNWGWRGSYSLQALCNLLVLLRYIGFLSDFYRLFLMHKNLTKIFCVCVSFKNYKKQKNSY